jgi:hypothetical protein
MMQMTGILQGSITSSMRSTRLPNQAASGVFQPGTMTLHRRIARTRKALSTRGLLRPDMLLADFAAAGPDC